MNRIILYVDCTKLTFDEFREKVNEIKARYMDCEVESVKFSPDANSAEVTLSLSDMELHKVIK